MVRSSLRPSPRRARRFGVLGLAAVASLALAACGSDTGEGDQQAGNADHFGYVVASRLVTTNAASAFGAASNAHVLSNRLYPAAFVPGPDGQIVQNTDLVRAEELPATEAGQRQVAYRISDAAKYSDGAPVVCEDFLLAYTAASMPALFGSHVPILNDIEHLECAPGAKDFTVTLKEGQGDRWRYLFGPGTVLPSHVVAARAGLDQPNLVAALQSWDPTQLQGVSDAWRFGFQLGDFDPEMQVSYGPFVIDKVGESGEVVLKRNPNYYGPPAELETMVIWPGNTADSELVESGAMRVADSTVGTPQWFADSAAGASASPESATSTSAPASGAPAAGTDSAAPAAPPSESGVKTRLAGDGRFQVVSMEGELTDTLLLSDAGVFAEQAARQAFAACVDQEALAKVSSAESGQDVHPVYVHALRHNDPIGKQLDGVAQAHRGTDVKAAGALTGATIRVGYLGPNARLAAMVESLRKSCEPAGITIVDSQTDYMSAGYLEPQPETGAPEIDAFLGAVDPMTEYSAPDARIKNVAALKKAEEKLWEEVTAIPIAAQPRTFIIDRGVENVVPYTGLAGIGWNMDRWSTSTPAVAASTDKEEKK